MMRTGITRMLLGAVLLTGLLTGCKQGLGERCQIDDDCGSDLICLLAGATRDVGGLCVSTNPSPPAADMTVPPDLTVAPSDLATPADLRGAD